MRAALSAVLLASTLAVAGCIGSTSEAPALDATSEDGHAAMDALDLVATGCKEGGGHSVHPRAFQELPEPWIPADIMDDVGPQVVWSEAIDPLNPQPAKGNTFGNWHSTMLCESMTFRGRAIEPAFFGYVGERIEKPVFDNSSGHEPDHHYLVTVVAVSDAELLEAFHHFGIQAMLAEPSWEALPGGLERIQMKTELNGAYDTIVKWTPWGEMMQHTRVWFQNTGKELPHGAEGHTPSIRAAPLAFDMWTTGGTHLVAEGQAYFSHTGTQHHGPAGAPPGHTAAVAYVDFDRAFAWGPSYPEYVLDVVWDH